MTAAEEADRERMAPELFDRLVRYLTETVAVVNAEGRVVSLLGAPSLTSAAGGVVGRHVFEFCPPEDLPYALELAVEALASSPGWNASSTVRLRRADGEITTFEVRIENHEDDPVIGGFVVHLRGVEDRTLESGSGLARPELGHDLESLASAVPLPIAFIGTDARLYYLNEAARKFCGDGVLALESEGLGALASGADRAELERAVQALLARPGQRAIVVENHSASGERRVVEVTISALGTSERVVALFATLVDVTARHLEESELRRRASSDPLTGLHNRMQVEEALAERLSAGGQRVGVLYLDLDGFKAVNDTFGHEAGDDFLVQVAGILRAEVRAADLVGRLGGDEFTVVVDLDGDGDEQDHGAATLESLAGRLAGAVARCSEATGLTVTTSVGAAQGVPGDSPRDVLRRADRAMYVNKRATRLAPTSS